MECSIKVLNRNIWLVRKEIKEKSKEIKNMEEIRRKTIDDKRELQGLMRVCWSTKGKANNRWKIYKIIDIILIHLNPNRHTTPVVYYT